MFLDPAFYLYFEDYWGDPGEQKDSEMGWCGHNSDNNVSLYARNARIRM